MGRALVTALALLSMYASAYGYEEMAVTEGGTLVGAAALHDKDSPAFAEIDQLLHRRAGHVLVVEGSIAAIAIQTDLTPVPVGRFEAAVG
jgi:hypothetical protein